MPFPTRPRGWKTTSATVKSEVDNPSGASVGGARRNASIKEDVESMRSTLEEFEAATLLTDSLRHAFLASVYIAYVSARDNNAVNELIAACCPDKMKGVTKRTHDVAKILKGILGEKGQEKERRQTIYEWKNCICGMIEHGVDKNDARKMLLEHGASFFCEKYKVARDIKNSKYKENNIKDRKIPKIKLTENATEKLSKALIVGGKIKAIIDIQKDGTLIITDVSVVKN
ncbi:hypothetical protein M2352_000569 [Azospirillum fermentarium]|uniref:hypothetical protein n=1 Tax=Azospirillum fermentarium TaxID=1233114 RepID=UPI0022268032|nr:hypothetical protein [Azospirillum fermentarium]MCW2244978.1 hypothetical protein [Azospirillum fermentarium]